MTVFCPKINAKSRKLAIFTISQKCDIAKTLDFIGFFEGGFYDETTISSDTKKEGSESMNLDELEKLTESIEVL